LYISTFGPTLSIISEHWPVLTSEVDPKTGQPKPLRPETALDLARAAAVSLDMIGTGTAPVRIELLSGPSPAGGEFTVQVGAFADRTNAERLRDRLLAAYQPIFIQDYDTPTGHFYRVRVGRVPSPDAAQQLAAQLRASDGFQTFVMRLDQINGLNTK
jgi:rare lipoprotein A